MKTKKRLKRLHRLMVQLAETLIQHARTDAAPDDALPAMKRLKKKIRKAGGG